MKLTIIILFLSLMQVSATVYSQATKFTFDAENKQVVDVLREIEDNSQFRFFYLREQVDVERRVSVKANDATVEQILDELFKEPGVNYELMNDFLIVLKKEDAPLGISGLSDSFGLQQQPAVSGTVTDESGEPLPGVTVVVKGTTQGTVTNADGEYQLSDIPENATLQFSFVGMRTQEVEVGTQTNIDISMEVDAIGIEEVVAVGYGTMKRRDLTGSVATVKNEDLIKAPVASTVNTLAGRLPGLVSKQTTGEPGKDAATINIRGFGTPLTIVDGIEQPFNRIDPNEIETVTILKDASSAIYGARAGNGVILVTTKRGNISEPKIKVNSSYTWQGFTFYPKRTNSGQYAELMNEVKLNDGENPIYSQEAIQKYYDGTDPIHYPNINWWDVVMKNYAPLQKHGISLNGGTENFKYYLFGGYTNQGGMYKSGDNKFTRYNVRANIDAQINKSLTVSVNLSAIHRELKSPVRTIENIWMDLDGALPTYHAEYPDKTKVPFGGYSLYNPLIYTNFDLGGYNKLSEKDLNGTISFNYNIPMIKGLDVNATFNYLEGENTGKVFNKQAESFLYDWDNDVYTSMGVTFPTSLSQNYSKIYRVTTQLSARYEYLFDNQKISALLLSEFINGDYSDWFSAYGTNFLTNNIDYLFAAGSEEQRVNGAANEDGRTSYVGRVNYSFKDKYIFQATARFDGSPRFNNNQRWGFFPSLSLGWRLSEEAFFDEAAWINNLKLRTSISNTGYDATGAFQYLTGYELTGDFLLINGSPQNGLSSTGLSNENITWEEMRTYNIGLDFALFNSFFYGEFDVFYRERSNILATRVESLPNTFGATLPAENINSLNNRGFEFLVGIQGKTDDLNYDISSNISYQRSKWDHYEEPVYTNPDDIRIRKRSGKWTNLRYGYVADGIFTSQEQIDNLEYDQDQKGNTTLKPGDVKYLDVNEDGIINSNDLDVIGKSSIPEVFFGLNANLKYKDFDFSMLWQGATNFNVQLAGAGFLIDSERTPKKITFEERWTPENNDPNALIPRLAFSSNSNNWKSSSFWTKDGTYIRLKSVNIGYTIPKKKLDRLGFEQIRFFLAGTNLLTFSELVRYEYDPEVSNTRGWSYPQHKTYSVGINITL